MKQQSRVSRLTQGIVAVVLAVGGIAIASVATPPAVVHASGSPAAGWAVMASANVSLVEDNQLQSVDCTSATNCWGVGFYCERTSVGHCDQSGVPTQTLTEQYNGTSWSVVSSPNAGTGEWNYLTGVTCTSASNCWAVGYYCTSTSNVCQRNNGPSYAQTLIEQYNGTSWSIVTSANVSTSEDNVLSGVTCNSSSDCWAVGYYCISTNNCPGGTSHAYQTLAEHYNGTSWSTATTPNQSTSENEFLSAVTCTSGSNCIAAGYYCDTTATCNGTSGHANQTLVETYNGTSWSLATSANQSTSLNNALSGVACASASDCWAVGNYGSASNQPLAEHYDGSTWTLSTVGTPSAAGDVYLLGVTCVSSDDCIAVGAVCASHNCGGGTSPQTAVEEWNGTSWYVEPSDNASGSVGDTLAGVSCVGGASPDNCMAVGYQCTSSCNYQVNANYLTYLDDEANSTLAEQYGGAVQGAPGAVAAWTTSAAAGDSSVSAPAAPSDASDPVNTYSGAAYTTASDISIPALGNDLNLTRTFNGPQETNETDNYLIHSTCVTSSDCWAVGWYCTVGGGGACATGSYAQTLIEFYDGTSWKTFPSPDASTTTTNQLDGVTCTSASDCWAVGLYTNGGGYWQTLTEHYNGTQWSVVSSPNSSTTANNQLQSVTCTSSSNCWAVGYYAPSGGHNTTLAENYNGTSWSIVSSPNQTATNDNTMNRVTCTSSSLCWTVGTYINAGGYYQTLIEKYNGTSWSIATSPNTSATQSNLLYGTTCVSSTDCWAVGFYFGTYDQTLTEHWNGTAWSIVTSPNSSTTQNNRLNTVVCTSSSNCWTSDYDYGTHDQTLVLQYTTSWAINTSPNTSTSQDNVAKTISCTSSTTCVIPGYYWDASGHVQTLAIGGGTGGWSIDTGTNVPTGGAADVWTTAMAAPFGDGWAFDDGMTVGAGHVGGTEVVTDESGATVTFTGSGSTWTAPAYNASTLSLSGGVWTYTRWNGQQFTFNSSGQLTSEKDRNGNTTTLAYTSGKLSSVTDPTSRALTFTTPSANITQVTDPDSQSLSYSYDTSGNLVGVTDQASNHLSYTYDGNHELLTATDRNGGVMKWAYDTSGRVVSTTDAAGHTTTYVYSVPATNETATLVTSPVGDEVQNTYYDGLLIKRVGAYGQAYAATTIYMYDPTTLALYDTIDANGTTAFDTFDLNGNMLSSLVTPVSGAPTSTSATYDSLSDQTSATDANGNSTSATFDADGNELTSVDGGGTTTTNTYNTNGTLCWSFVGTSSNTCASPPTGSTVDTYDSHGNLASSTDPTGNKTTDVNDVLSRKTSEVSPAGNVSGCSCAAANTTTYTYDALNHQLTSVAPIGTTTNTYDANGNLLTTEDPAATYTTNTYDADNRTCWTLVAASASTNTCASPPSGATSQTYDADGNTATATDAKGAVTTYGYNALNQKISETQTSLGGAESSYTYDGNGNVLTSTAPNGNVSGCGCASAYTTTNTYDYGNRLLTTKDPAGHTTTNTYDSNGNLLTTTDGSGNVTSNAYDANNRLCWTFTSSSAYSSTCGAPPTGAVVKTYDGSGNLVTVTDGNGHVTTNAYDSSNKLCWTYLGTSANACGSPPSGSTVYTYDANGNLTQTENPDGTYISSAYDASNQRCWTYAGNSTNACASPPTGATTYTYDSDGRRLTMTDGTGTSTWAYDTLGHELSYENGAGDTVHYTTDANGNDTKITYPDGTVLSQAFDAANRMCWNYVGTSTNACASPPTGSNVYGYDPSGNLTTETLANGVVNTYNYDGTGSISSISDGASGSVFGATYTRNGDNLLSTDSNQPSTVGSYKYTAKNQLCYAGSANGAACTSPPSGSDPYTSDSAGNLTSNNGTTQAYDSKDELCWSKAGSYTSACGSPPSTPTTYTYNANGDRTATTPASGSASAYSYNSYNELTQYQLGSGAATTYAYNGDGLRMSKTTGGTATSFDWSDASGLPLLLQETTSSNITKYVYGPTGEPVEEILPSASKYFYAHDSLGSTRALTDSLGAVQDTDAYDPYGNITTTGSVQNNLLYAGQYLDSESGVYYLRAREYDPVTAQFLTVDPLVSETTEPYTYAAGDPTNAEDPRGTIPGNAYPTLLLRQLTMTCEHSVDAALCFNAAFCDSAFACVRALNLAQWRAWQYASLRALAVAWRWSSAWVTLFGDLALQTLEFAVIARAGVWYQQRFDAPLNACFSGGAVVTSGGPPLAVIRRVAASDKVWDEVKEIAGKARAITPLGLVSGCAAGVFAWASTS